MLFASFPFHNQNQVILMKTFPLLRAVVLSGLLLSGHFSIGQTGNYFAGFQSGTSNTGSYNAFVGYQSGVSANTGWYNTFLGYQSGYLNKGGSYNVFVGSFAGYDNTTGLSNTFVGWAAGSNNTTAGSNSFFGNLAGYQTSTGGNNSFFGSASAYNNTTGSNNAFFGSRAGYNNISAGNNTFIGFSAGEKNTSGANNTFVGSQAGFPNTTGYRNSFLGYEAGKDNTTGYNNSFLGYQSGMANTSGANNIFLGYQAGRYNTTGRGNVMIGYHATAPSTAAGITNAVAIGFRASVRTSNSLVLGGVNGVNGATVNTKVGIGTTAPGYLLHVNGTAAKPGGGSWTAASDKRLKQNIAEFTDGLQVLEQVRPVTFRYNGKAGLPTDQQFVGVIAQEMQKIAPYTVGKFIYQEEEGQQEEYLDYDATALTYILVNSVKELKKENEELKVKVAELEILKQELAQIRAALNLPGQAVPATGGGARLGQNVPNPYTQSTAIPYFVPESAASAQIKIFSTSGKEVYSVTLSKKGAGEVTLRDSQFAAGTYLYHLVVDGQSVDQKKLVLVR
jgi:hypothetical protein